MSQNITIVLCRDDGEQFAALSAIVDVDGSIGTMEDASDSFNLTETEEESIALAAIQKIGYTQE